MSAFRALIISPDGTVADQEWDVNDKSLLPALQEAVDGLVDVVAFAEDLDMWVNDEGLYTQPLNPIAGFLVSVLGAGRGFQPYWFGTVVFTGGADRDGNTQPLPAAWAAQIAGLVEAVCHA